MSLRLVPESGRTPRFLLAFFCLALAFPAIATAEQTPHFHNEGHAPTLNPDWMRWLSDSTHLATLSIPGTQDTLSFNALEWYYSDYLHQSMELRTQLDAGIRFVDIPVTHVGDRLIINHASYFFGELPFEHVLSTTIQFLSEHPAETVLLRISEASSPQGTTRSLDETVLWYRNQPGYAPYLWCGTAIPSLGQVRGKIVILNDFNGTCGIPWSALPRQEQWSGDLTEKWNLVRNHLTAASSGNPATLYANSLDGAYYQDWWSSVPTFARDINQLTLGYLNGGSVQRAGVVMMNFPGAGLINSLVGQNFQQNIFSVPVGGSRQTLGVILEQSTHRAGMDYQELRLPDARPELCRSACFNDQPTCKAFTYIKPVGSTPALCRLKSGIPARTADASSVSGVVTWLAGGSSSPLALGTTLELDISRPGSDYTFFDLPMARPELCRQACFSEQARCKSFTYIKPGVGGAKWAQCRLKSTLASPALDANAISGTALTGASMGFASGLVEINTDRPGMTYKSIELPEARPELCQQACQAEPQLCKSFTYGRPGGSATSKPQCYLKLGIPAPVPNPWCDSGISGNP